MAPRGLSAEEKRVKLLEIFHETKDFYQLKELEKLGPKMKGIVSQSVKEVLQSLVDDGSVQSDKIGSSNFFWSFPSQRGGILQNRLDAAKETRAAHEKQLAELRAETELARSTRPESSMRTACLANLTNLRQRLATLEQEFAAFGTCDAASVEERRRAAVLAKEAAGRWTDNYSLLLSHFTRQNGVDPGEVRRYLGVGEDYEDIM